MTNEAMINNNLSDTNLNNNIPADVAISQEMLTLVNDTVAKALQQLQIPSATYRIQLNEQFTFRDAMAMVPYFHSLGISHLYASPILKSRSGSTHGYDVCDHNQISPILGTEADFEALINTLHEHGMGLILDTVPNHMGIGDPCNSWWMDVLENGPASMYSSYFDIDWQPIKPELENKVLLPILGDQYGVVLENGEFKLHYEDGAFFIYYYTSKLPISPTTYTNILTPVVERLTDTLDTEQLQELQSILTALGYLPPQTEYNPEKISERHREKEVIKRRIAALVKDAPPIQAAIESVLETLNGTVGDPHSFDTLDNLINAQAYRLSYWRVAAEEINYRRFFDINDLAAIRVELPEVFRDTHALIYKWLVEGKVNGLRIDHPDGLWNPTAYFQQLQEGYIQALMNGSGAGEEVAQAISTWFNNRDLQTKLPLYVVVEKILSEREPLPIDWAVYGTTGYDFANSVNGIFIDSRNTNTLDTIYKRFSKVSGDFANLIKRSKTMTMEIGLTSEINSLGHELERVNEKTRRYRDFTLNGLIHALREVITSLSIYRTYITAPDNISERDKFYIESAIEDAKRRNPRTAASIFDYLRDIFLLRQLDEFQPEDRQSLINFVMKFQQVTGPVMAKSVEDTAFYVYNRLVALNEVGGDPEKFGTSVAEFHNQNMERARCWPHAMLTTSTHDTKRSEDVRARIDVISELPDEWNAALNRWKRLNGSHKQSVSDTLVPDRNDEYLLYQILIGTLPTEAFTEESMAQYRERISAYMMKAAKEAKVHTSWINPNEGYDKALQQFVSTLLDMNKGKRFLEDITAFAHRIAYYGQINALSQQVLKLTSPGIPDIYQGTELWDLSLVDPDNRRPVDYEIRRSLLESLSQKAIETNPQAVEDFFARIDGAAKLYITHCILSCRRELPELFGSSQYIPLNVYGDKADHICAFMRTTDDKALIVVAPRLVVGLTNGMQRLPVGADVWGDTRLELPVEYRQRQFKHVFTGETRSGDSLQLAEVLKTFPMLVAITA